MDVNLLTTRTLYAPRVRRKPVDAIKSTVCRDGMDSLCLYVLVRGRGRLSLVQIRLPPCVHFYLTLLYKLSLDLSLELAELRSSCLLKVDQFATLRFGRGTLT